MIQVSESEHEQWREIIERAALIIGSDHRNPGVVLAALEIQNVRITRLEAELATARGEVKS